MTLGSAGAVHKTGRILSSALGEPKSHAPAPRELVELVGAEGAPFCGLFEPPPLALERGAAG